MGRKHINRRRPLSRVWFITGASSGFGRALAEAVLDQGDQAILIARRADAFQQIARNHPDTTLPITADVTNVKDRKRAVKETLVRFGRIDVLANNARQGPLGAAEEFTPQQLRGQMELNFFAAAELTRAVLPAMRSHGSGHILNLTSIGGLKRDTATAELAEWRDVGENTAFNDPVAAYQSPKNHTPNEG